MIIGRRKKLIAISCICLLVLFIWLYPYLFRWSKLCCEYQDIDINSGRIRYTHYLFYCKVSERIEESVFSQALLHEDLAGIKPDWHRVHTFSPGVRYSPHYNYHSAISQMQGIANLWQIREFSPEAKRKAVQTALSLWQTGGNDFATDKYLGYLNELTDGESVVEVADLPALPEQ